MTIHTDTFPALLSGAANSPQLQLRRDPKSGNLILENIHTGVQVDISPCLAKHSFQAIKPGDVAPINVIGTRTLKQLLERMSPPDAILL